MNNQTIEQLNKRKFDDCLFCIYAIPVPIYLNTGENCINSKTLLMFFGCNIHGKRFFLSSVISDDFTKPTDWYNFFISFKSRGIKTILFALLPDIKILKSAISLAFADISVFNSYTDSLFKISKYFTLKYSSNVFDIVRKIYISYSIDDYLIYYDEFKDIFSDSPFLIDLLDNDFIKAKSYYSYPFLLRKHIFSFYFIRELSKKLTVISHSKSFSSASDFVLDSIPIIQLIEKRCYCPKSEWLSLINIIYSSPKKDLIKCYL